MTDQITLLKDRVRNTQAVVFDMDGILVDSEKHHFLAHQRALAEFGAEIDRSFYIAHGISTNPAMFYARAFNRERLPDELIKEIHDRKRDIYKRLQQEDGIIPIQPAIALVKTLHKRKIPLAIGTGVHKNEVKNNLKVLGIEQYFAVIVAGNDFPLRNKPFPDIYLKVAELLRLHPEECLAIEDSGNGAAAAVSAGMTCIVVPNDYTRAHHFAGATVMLSFDEVSEMFIKGLGDK